MRPTGPTRFEIVSPVSFWLLVAICIIAAGLLMALSHGAQELAYRVWAEIEGGDSPQGGHRRVVHTLRVAGLLFVVVGLVVVVVAAKVAEDQARSYPPSQILESIEQEKVDTINDSVLGPDRRRPVATMTPVPMSEELREVLRNMPSPNSTTTAPADQP